MSRSKTPEPIAAIRRALELDTWGADIMRLKTRIGAIMQVLDSHEDEMTELSSRLARLEEQHPPFGGITLSMESMEGSMNHESSR
jgi:hypothetical protein